MKRAPRRRRDDQPDDLIIGGGLWTFLPVYDGDELSHYALHRVEDWTDAEIPTPRRKRRRGATS